MRTCDQVAPQPRGSATAAAGVPACAGPVRCPGWHADQAVVSAPGDGILSGKMAVAGADGGTVYVASYESRAPTVTAYATADGTRLWSAKSGDAKAIPFAIARAADGTLAVALTRRDGDSVEGFVWLVDPAGATRAVVSTGSQTEVLDVAAAGSVVVAGGTSGDQRGLATAVAPTTGKIAWRQSWASATPGLRSSGWRVAGSPAHAYLAAAGIGANGYTQQLALVVLDPSDGRIEHVTTRNVSGVPPAGVAVSPDGATVLMVEANLDSLYNEILTQVFDGDGTPRWSARYRGCDVFKCSTRPWYGEPGAISADGRHVVVSGLGVAVGAVTAWATVAYDAATGVQEWAVRTPINARDCFCGPAVTATATTAYVTGELEDDVATTDPVTQAFALGDGGTSWVGDDRAPNESAMTSALTLAGDRLVTVGLAGTPLSTQIHTTVAAFDL